VVKHLRQEEVTMTLLLWTVAWIALVLIGLHLHMLSSDLVVISNRLEALEARLPGVYPAQDKAQVTEPPPDRILRR
jgi:hypothetical protein